MKTLILVLFSISCYSQHEYAQIFTTMKGMAKSESYFSFGEHRMDSAKLYPTFRFFVDALNYADSKGWEVIDVYNNGLLQNAVLRRKHEIREAN